MAFIYKQKFSKNPQYWANGKLPYHDLDSFIEYAKNRKDNWSEESLYDVIEQNLLEKGSKLIKENNWKQIFENWERNPYHYSLFVLEDFLYFLGVDFWNYLPDDYHIPTDSDLERIEDN